MKKINVPIEEFARRFEQEYGFLYDAEDRVAGFADACNAFDEFIEDPQQLKFVQEFNAYRGDIIASDREAAAFMLVLGDMAEEVIA